MDEEQVNKNVRNCSIKVCLPACGSRLLLFGLKPTLQLVLLLVFLRYFGLPAVEEYRASKVMVVESRKASGGIPVPGVTIMAGTNPPWSSWRGRLLGGVGQVCANFTSYGSLHNCLENTLYNQTDFIHGVVKGFTRKLPVTEYLREDFVMSTNGRMFTFDMPHKIGPNYKEDQLFFLLKYDLSYCIHIHDSKFYLGIYNPIFPIQRLSEINPNASANYFYYPMLTEVEELDLPEDPCNPDPDYNFQACVRGSFSSQVGCRTRWDRWSQDLPTCTTIQQFR